MSIVSSSRSILFALYRSWILRILILLAVLLVVGYYKVALPWLNRSISENYFQQTGHKLQFDPLEIHLLKGKVALHHIKDSASLWQIDHLNIDIDCWHSLQERNLFINEIAIQKLTANTQQAEDGSWNFDDVIKHVSSANKPGDNKKTSKKATPLVIKKLVIANSTINSNARAINNLPLVITPLAITLSNIDLRRAGQTNVTVKAQVNESIPLSVTGTVNLTSLQADLALDVSNVPVVWFNDFVKPYVALEILHGSIETHTKIAVNAGELHTLISDGKLNELKVRPTTMEQDAVKWKSFEWSNVDVQFNQRSVHIPLLTLNEFDGQLIITKDRTTNIQAMIIKPVPQAPSNPSLQTQAMQVSPTAQPAQQSNTWKFTVDRMAINNAALGFFDESLKPTFSTIVQQFNGDIINISNDAEHVAEIKLAGNVDGYAPVALNGKANFFIAQPQLDALFSFQKMDMGAFSPYSAEYAGWRIKKGLLSVDLNYHYDRGRIVGKNHVVIDHLEFGEKVRSTHIIDIPLRMALSLLTDENGVAVLDADISGDPQDPNFNVRETIWRALRNTVKKIATAPFRILGNLLKTKEDLGSIQFTPGESQLSQEAINKLELLQEALKKRPNMRLTAHGMFDEKRDENALRYEQVKSALQKQGLAKESIAQRDAVWAQAVNALYLKQALTNINTSADDKYEELAAVQVVLPERLHNLAHERAQAVKQYFVLQLGAASEKLLLDSENTCDKSNLCTSSSVMFTLED